MAISVDPNTGKLLGVEEGRTYTWAELQRIDPPCPHCGSRISVIPIPVDSLGGSGPTQLYMFGRHQFNCDCWNG